MLNVGKCVTSMPCMIFLSGNLFRIDHWDAEKERLLFLTEKSLISLKYDFITLKLLDYKRYPLTQFQRITIGELKYPENSLMP